MTFNPQDNDNTQDRMDDVTRSDSNAEFNSFERMGEKLAASLPDHDGTEDYNALALRERVRAAGESAQEASPDRNAGRRLAPDARFVGYTMSRQTIADHLNTGIGGTEFAAFTGDDPRLTDFVCRNFATAFGSMLEDSAAEGDCGDAIMDVVIEALVDLGYTCSEEEQDARNDIDGPNGRNS